MSDYRGYQGRDPAERLSTALDRIALALERREAQARSAAASAGAAGALSAAGSDELPAIAANLDALIARLRAVLDTAPPDATSPEGAVHEAHGQGSEPYEAGPHQTAGQGS